MTVQRYITTYLRTGLIFLSVCFFVDVYPQTTVITDSIINEYSRIITIHSSGGSPRDSVYLEDATAFHKNEVALFIVNQGAEIVTGGTGKGDIANMNNTGKYVLIFIDTVEYDNKLVIFNSTLQGVAALKPGEMAQLVTVPRYKNMIIANTLTCKAWDPATGTGGVLAFIVNNMLELQAGIDVSGKGFKGANPGVEQYEGGCSSEGAGYLNDFFTFAAKDSGALRGEGIAVSGFPYPRGRMAIGNSGSGGNGKFSGGGGGSNAGSGGLGGKESSSCSLPGSMGGIGGSLPSIFYSNTGQYANRIYMGGGGGTSTQDITGGKAATRGGNGGGIVIFSANTVKASGNFIRSNGESVMTVAGAGGGGGGGGGVVIADVVEYTDPLIVEVKGGNGGHVQTVIDTTGPGGGGGGGVYWFNQSGPGAPANVTSLRTFGEAGKVDGSNNAYGATNGSLGSNIPNLVMPRRGFLVNKIPDDQVICENDVPDPLLTQPAKGGSDGPYTYKWLQSETSFEGPWVSAVGLNDQQNFSPPALTDTTFYSRIISDGSLIDTSFAIMIAVHPRLINNNLSYTDTVCAQLSAGNLAFPSALQGGLGDGSYVYTWEKSPDGSTWQIAEGNNNLSDYDTPVMDLAGATYYRRQVASGACIDNNNSFLIQVLPILENNSIASDQIICHGQQPQGLTGSSPVGGLAGDRRYVWEGNTGQGDWTELSTGLNYTPGQLTDTTFYRRTVYSGPGNTCKNISNVISVLVLPSIDNNVLNNQDTVLCAELPGLSLTGSQPIGGDGVYTYVWEKRLFATDNWLEAQQGTTLQQFETGNLSDSTWFRRVIISGLSDVCIHISDSILVSVLPAITNNSVSAPQIICENAIPVPLTGSTPAGGVGVYDYEWQVSPDGTGNWENASPPGSTAGYAPPALSNSTYFRRAVYSGPENTCKSFSESIKMEVQPAITNNFIPGGYQYFTCFNTQPEIIEGSINPAGGDGSAYSYTWEESRNLSAWTPGSQINSGADYLPQVLTDSIYLRRLVSSGQCTDTSEIIKVAVHPLPVLLSLTGSTVGSICDDEPFSLNLEIGTGKAPFQVKYSNAIDAGTFDQLVPAAKGSFNVTITGEAPNNYQFMLTQLTDDNLCQATPENLILNKVNIDVYRAPRPSIGMADEEEVCGSLVTLTGIQDVGNGVWRVTNPYIVMADSMNANTLASLNLNSFNTLDTKFYYVESTPGCGERKDSVRVVFYEQPDDAVITTDTTGLSPFIVFLSDHLNLNAISPSAGSGFWEIDQGPGSITSQSSASAHLADLEIDKQTRVIYSITNGVCETKSTFFLIERKEVKIYQGFSPNGDSQNDYLYAEGINRSSDDLRYTFTIFNSTGTFVRELTHETMLETGENDAIWDGVSQNGKMSGDGTYYYVMNINYKGSDFTYKGFFVIKSE